MLVSLFVLIGITCFGLVSLPLSSLKACLFVVFWLMGWLDFVPWLCFDDDADCPSLILISEPHLPALNSTRF